MSHALRVAFREQAVRRGQSPPALIITNNRVRVLSWRGPKAALEVRVAKRLLDLGRHVVDPIVGTVFGAEGASDELRDLIKVLPPAPKAARRRQALQPKGACYDLTDLLTEQIEHLECPVERPVSITWGRHLTGNRVRRSIRFGSYDVETSTIRIHRRLDNQRVPRWFVGFIVFHELLHHVVGIEMRNGRRVIHSKSFRDLEARHPDYRRAMDWEKQHLSSLLSRARGGAR